MIRHEVDVAVLGAGFGGSLAAMVLERSGFRTALVDRGSHPRFAIGESSTPVADLILREFARRHGLPPLERLSRYGSWVRHYPHVTCGLKRGFSYFRHEAGRPFAPRADHANELLVAASSEDELADTHWLRADVDALLAAEAVQAGVAYCDRTETSVQRNAAGGWQLEGERSGEPVGIEARFLIDATGEATALAKALGFEAREAEPLETRSWSMFGHFRGLRRWRDVLQERGAAVGDHPFDCDAAALHHVLDEGWMWQLPFRNGVTSAGFALDLDALAPDAGVSPRAQWQGVLERYPSIAAQFADAELVAPPGGLRRTGRLQRIAARCAGRDWAALPHTAGFIDPLHSTGIAHTMSGVERVVGILQQHWQRRELPEALRDYESTVRNELRLVDRLVSGCYRARGDFRLFVAFAMLYFTAATNYETRRLAGRLPAGAALLLADDAQVAGIVERQWQQLQALTGAGRPLDAQRVAAFERGVAAAIGPLNVAGLCDPSAGNMYRHTAVRI